ncbi:hypothetical protein [Bacteroides sp.]
MRNFNFLFMLCGMAVVSSCSESNLLGDNEMALMEMNQTYELSETNLKELDDEDDGPKIETIADEAAIKESMDSYIAEVMNRQSNAKEKVSRNASGLMGLVGVFKVGSCGSYKELEIKLDCEDRKSISRITGKVGDSSVDGSGNVSFRFCLTEANRYYPGSVLLIDDYSYTSQAVLRHHDVEDKNPNNIVLIGGFEQVDRLPGKFTSVTKEDAVLAWGFQGGRSLDTPVGPAYIQYGLVVFSNMACGRILTDDEDKNNKNWVKVLEKGVYTDYPNREGSEKNGIILGGNTEYCIGLSTEHSFTYPRI